MIEFVSHRKKCIKRWLKSNYSLKIILLPFCTNMDMFDTLLKHYLWCRQGSSTKFYLRMLRYVTFFSLLFHQEPITLISTGHQVTFLGGYICPWHHEKEDVAFILYFRIARTIDCVSNRPIHTLHTYTLYFSFFYKII